MNMSWSASPTIDAEVLARASGHRVHQLNVAQRVLGLPSLPLAATSPTPRAHASPRRSSVLRTLPGVHAAAVGSRRRGSTAALGGVCFCMAAAHRGFLARWSLSAGSSRPLSGPAWRTNVSPPTGHRVGARRGNRDR